MILTDANILMYAAGGDHPHKAPSLAFLTRAAAAQVDATINAETLQEILHGYRSIGRPEDAERVYDLARTIFSEVLAITGDVLDEARRILSADTAVMTRDAVHAAVVRVYGLEGICSFDRDFDRIPNCPRVRI